MRSLCELSGRRAQGVGGPAPEVDFYSHLVYQLLPLLTGLNTKLGVRECEAPTLWGYHGNLPNQDHFDLCSVPAPAYYCRMPGPLPLVYTLGSTSLSGWEMVQPSPNSLITLLKRFDDSLKTAVMVESAMSR